MDIRQLEIFSVLAHELNFTRTAERLNTVQSNVTTRIRGLEEELGTALFERIGRRVILTESGRNLLTYTERILGLLDETKAAVCQTEENPSGNLNIGAPESVLTYRLPPVLKVFRERYPNVRLSLRPDQLSATRQKLDDGRVDLIFIIDEPIHDQNLCVDDLGVEPVVVVGPSDHVLARRKQIFGADLQGETLLLTEAGCCYRQRFEQALIAAKVHPKSVVEYSSIEAVKKCVASGMGIGVLPQISVRTEMRNGVLAPLRWKGPSLTMRRQLVWRRTKWISPALAAFRKTLATARPE